MRIAKCLALFFLLNSPLAAEQLKTTFNAFTGKLDYITRVDSTTLPSGSTQYVQIAPAATQAGGFDVATGSISTSIVAPIVISNGSSMIFKMAGTEAMRIISGGNIGIGDPTAPQKVTIQDSVNSNLMAIVTNLSNGGSAQSNFKAVNDAGDFFQNGVFGSGNGGFGALLPREAFVYSGGNLNVMANQGTAVIKFSAGGNLETMRLDASGNLGIGTPSPSASLHVLSGTLNTYELRTSSASTLFHLAVSTSGHVVTGGPAPAISACGATPSGSVSGNDNQGTITVGGGVVTSCVLTFASTWGVTPVCVFNADSSTISSGPTAKSATAITVGFSATLGGGQVEYHCGCSGSACR